MGDSFQPHFCLRVKIFQLRPLVVYIEPVVMEIQVFMSLNEETFQFGSIFWRSRVFRIATQGNKSLLSKSGSVSKTKDWDFAARSQASGYREFKVGFDKELWNSLVIFRQHWTDKNPKQGTKSLLLTAKIPLHLMVCEFRLSKSIADW